VNSATTPKQRQFARANLDVEICLDLNDRAPSCMNALVGWRKAVTWRTAWSKQLRKPC